MYFMKKEIDQLLGLVLRNLYHNVLLEFKIYLPNYCDTLIVAFLLFIKVFNCV